MIFIFDLDDVLIHEGFMPPILCSDSLVVLNIAKQHGRLALASHNSYASPILKSLGLDSMFEVIAGYRDVDKLTHFKGIKHLLGVEYSDCIFFDDLEPNIKLADSLGMKTCLVNHITGISVKDILQFL